MPVRRFVTQAGGYMTVAEGRSGVTLSTCDQWRELTLRLPDLDALIRELTAVREHLAQNALDDAERNL